MATGAAPCLSFPFCRAEQSGGVFSPAGCPPRSPPALPSSVSGPSPWLSGRAAGIAASPTPRAQITGDTQRQPGATVTKPSCHRAGHGQHRAQAQCPKPRRAQPRQRGAKAAPRLNPCGAPALRSLCCEGARCKGNKENTGVRAPSRQQAPSGREPQAQPSRSVHGHHGSWELLSGRGVPGPGWGRAGAVGAVP